MVKNRFLKVLRGEMKRRESEGEKVWTNILYEIVLRVFYALNFFTLHRSSSLPFYRCFFFFQGDHSCRPLKGIIQGTRHHSKREGTEMLTRFEHYGFECDSEGERERHVNFTCPGMKRFLLIFFLSLSSSFSFPLFSSLTLLLLHPVPSLWEMECWWG